MDRNDYKIWRNLDEAEGKLAYSLRVFGNTLAERQGYQEHRGIEAVHFYLCDKYSWLPSTVKAMSGEDLRFMLEEEMHGWVMPPEACGKE